MIQEFEDGTILNVPDVYEKYTAIYNKGKKGISGYFPANNSGKWIGNLYLNQEEEVYEGRFNEKNLKGCYLQIAKRLSVLLKNTVTIEESIVNGETTSVRMLVPRDVKESYINWALDRI